MKRRTKNYNILAGFDGYAPGAGGVIALLLWLVLGTLIGNIVTIIYGFCLGFEFTASHPEYSMIIAYPLMFIPAMIWAGAKSRKNNYLNPFEEGSCETVPIDQNNFGSLKPLGIALMVMVATVAAQILCDNFSLWMPQMPEFLEETLKGMTSGNIWVNLLLVGIFAPFFEEWLCRGMILRGLATKTKIGPVWTVIISALIFGLIHGNPWQALPAIVIGILFGYVYIKTGSLKLTMLMHCTNNTLAVILSQFTDLDEMDSLLEIMAPWQYVTLVATSAVLLVLFIRILSRSTASSMKAA